MPFAFHLPWLLLGLVAVVLPIIIYLLNRRFDVVDWAAMRFLKVSQKTRRKVFLEDLLLILLRMLIVAVLVLGLAGPFSTRTVSIPGTRPARDLVLIVDGSASMGCLTAEGKQTAQQAAVARVEALLDDLQPGDGVGLIEAREQPLTLLAPTVDRSRLRAALAGLSPPEGGCDAPAALAAARQLLQDSARGQRDVLILTDGQRAGYADANNRVRWELLASQERAARKRDDHRTAPNVNIILVDPARAVDPPNWSLGPLRTTRGVVPVGREVLFRGEIEMSGRQHPGPPHRLGLLIDGKPVRNLKLSADLKFETGKVPFHFTHRFARPGSHLVTVLLEPDPPLAERPPEFVARDFVPADNRQDFALEVVPFLPVLLVDGGNDPDATDRGLVFLRSALAPAGDPNPALRIESVALAQFDALLLTEHGSSPRPRVVVFQDVPALSKTQNDAVEQFLQDGGGVLIALGANADVAAYNERLYRQGQGWLPARLDKSEGDENKLDDAARVFKGTAHPVLELFRDVEGPGSIETARFPRYWQVTVPGNEGTSSIMAMLRTATGQSPLLVERAFGAGRVVLATVPLDASRGSTLPRLPAFVPLVNELVSYLAGVRTQSQNLAVGQPLHYRAPREMPLNAFALTPPGSDKSLTLDTLPGVRTSPRPPRGMVVTIDRTRHGGVYRLDVPRRIVVLCPDNQAAAWKQAGAIEAGDDGLLQRILRDRWLDFDLVLCTADRAELLPRLDKVLRPRGLLPDAATGTLLTANADPAATFADAGTQPVYYVVGRDRTEADLTPMGDSDRADLTRLLAAKFLEDQQSFAAERQNVEQRPEFWWLVLLALVTLLCGEVWLTSRIARSKV